MKNLYTVRPELMYSRHGRVCSILERVYFIRLHMCASVTAMCVREIILSKPWRRAPSICTFELRIYDFVLGGGVGEYRCPGEKNPAR